jgi:hypothetical protein
LGSLTCEEGGNLSIWYLGFIYVSSEGRIGCEFIHPAQPTDAPSSSRSHLYSPGFPGVEPFQRTNASRAKKSGAYSTTGTPSGRGVSKQIHNQLICKNIKGGRIGTRFLRPRGISPLKGFNPREPRGIQMGPRA